MRVRSISGKSYILVIVDDFSRFTWVDFLKDKGKALKPFSKCCKEMQTMLNFPIVSVRSDQGRDFDQLNIDHFCEKIWYNSKFSAPRKQQKNSVVERKNRTLEEMVRACSLKMDNLNTICPKRLI